MSWTSITDQSTSWNDVGGGTGVVFLLDETTGQYLIEEDSSRFLIDESATGTLSDWTSINDKSSTWNSLTDETTYWTSRTEPGDEYENSEWNSFTVTESTELVPGAYFNDEDLWEEQNVTNGSSSIYGFLTCYGCSMDLVPVGALSPIIGETYIFKGGVGDAIGGADPAVWCGGVKVYDFTEDGLGYIERAFVAETTETLYIRSAAALTYQMDYCSVIGPARVIKYRSDKDNTWS